MSEEVPQQPAGDVPPPTTPITPAEAKAELKKLVRIVRRELTALTGLFRRSLDHAKVIGEALSNAHELVKHGHWTVWLEENFHMSVRTAGRYVAIYERFDDIVSAAEAKGLAVAELGIALALDLIAEPKVKPEPEPEPVNPEPQPEPEPVITEPEPEPVIVEDRGDVADAVDVFLAQAGDAIDRLFESVQAHPERKGDTVSTLRSLRDRIDAAIQRLEAI